MRKNFQPDVNDKVMSMKEDIIRILVEYRDKIHDGNTDRAAKALNVHTPTLWRWLKGENIPKVESISDAFDTLDARIVLPGELSASSSAQTQELRFLRNEIKHLSEKNALLQKLVSKYEEDEHIKNEDQENNEAYTHGPASFVDEERRAGDIGGD